MPIQQAFLNNDRSRYYVVCTEAALLELIN